MPQPLIILGAGTFAMDVADIISDIPAFEVAGFAVSIDPHQPGDTLLDKPVYWLTDLAGLALTHAAVCAIVSTRRRAFVEAAATLGMRFATIVHPSARVSRMAQLAEGVVVNAGVIVATHAVIERHAILNRGAIIGHHARIGPFATVSPGANLAGAVDVGAGAYVGLGAIVLEKKRIGEGALVGAGSLVTKDVSPRTLVIGSPARVAQEGIEPY
ncbi:MAG: NeuD/PglB/VioB family sugar acetyltransferase [Chloroflexi bacterium]|nr:NeuD/PglB/VioB family sugar acetyltransferase [Chloroflexota bacterium]